MKNKKYLDKIIHGDALKLLSKIESNSIDIILTDPPYFLDKLDKDWSVESVNKSTSSQQVKSLPAGMQFDQEKGEQFYRWYSDISKKLYRVLKPGGFFFSFSSPRLYHRMASAIDDSGFEIRDCFLWIYTQNQPKAMSLNHFIKHLDLDKKKTRDLEKKIEGWKTPKIKSCFEPISLAQKPKDGTFLENILEHEVGLFNTQIKVGQNMFPANILLFDKIDPYMERYFLIKKPSKKEKKKYNTHLTVKPIALCEHLIKLSAFSENAVILDPFIGSGTTAVAALNLSKHYIGMDINKEYVDIAKKRIKSETAQQTVL